MNKDRGIRRDIAVSKNLEHWYTYTEGNRNVL